MEGKIICENDIIVLRLPVAADIPDLVRLRNQPEIRKCFFNDALVDQASTGNWLKNILKFPRDVVLVISLKANEACLGTFGWTYTGNEAEADVGRAMLDSIAFKNAAFKYGIKDRQIIYESGRMVMEYLFTRLNMKKIVTSWFKSNKTSEKINLHMGMCITHEDIKLRNDIPLTVVYAEMSKEKWLELHG